MISSFGNFYNNLSSDGVFFFWIIVFLFVFLIFLSTVLVIKNNKLSKLLKEKIILDNASKAEYLKQKEEITAEREEVLVNKVEEVKEQKIKEKEETIPYHKNILREMDTRDQTSPIHIAKKASLDSNTSINSGDDQNSLLGIDLGEDAVCLLENMEDICDGNDKMKFTSEIVDKMEKEIKPSNIELTEYEKKQEEEAIISYGELLKVKDKIYNITDDDETEDFIEELKSFRLNLQ